MFNRTSCACQSCVQCCKDQPGPLIPGDFERIAEALGDPVNAWRYFWASPGALVQDTETGRQRWIRTITPRREHGRCVFLDDQDRCRIHAVAPFGCAYFDTHQSQAEAQRRGVYYLQLIEASPEYRVLRSSLPFADWHKPRT